MAMVVVTQIALLLLLLVACSPPFLLATIAVCSVVSPVLLSPSVVSPPLGVSTLVLLCPVVSSDFVFCVNVVNVLRAIFPLSVDVCA